MLSIKWLNQYLHNELYVVDWGYFSIGCKFKWHVSNQNSGDIKSDRGPDQTPDSLRLARVPITVTTSIGRELGQICTPSNHLLASSIPMVRFYSSSARISHLRSQLFRTLCNFVSWVALTSSYQWSQKLETQKFLILHTMRHAPGTMYRGAP